MKRLVIETEKLKSNIEVIKKKADGRLIYGVLKGNGYGLGIEPMAELCLSKGIRRFAVTELKEAEVLRRMDQDAQILLLRPTMDREEMKALLELEVIATISSTEHAAGQ